MPVEKTENKTVSATENGSNGSPPVSVEVIAATIVDSSANFPESTQCIVAEVVPPVPGETSPEAIAQMFAQLDGKGDSGDKNRDTDVVDSAIIDDGVDNVDDYDDSEEDDDGKEDTILSNISLREGSLV